MQSPNQHSPVRITNKKIEALRDHINRAFNAYNEQGELDLDKCQRNVSYTIGNTYTNYNGILLQERHKLAEIESDLKHFKAIAYDKVKRFTDYVVDAANVKTLVEGNEDVRTKQLEYDKQSYYVNFLEATLKQIGYYANGVRVMIQREELKARWGE